MPLPLMQAAAPFWRLKLRRILPYKLFIITAGWFPLNLLLVHSSSDGAHETRNNVFVASSNHVNWVKPLLFTWGMTQEMKPMFSLSK